MLSVFIDLPLFAYDADVTIDQLPEATREVAMVKLLVLSRVSRRAMKEHLHRLGLESTSGAVDLALDTVRARADFPILQQQAEAFGHRVAAAPTRFDPLDDLRRQLRRCMTTAEDFAAQIASQHEVPAQLVLDALAARIDPPASLLIRMLEAAGAQRVAFAPQTDHKATQMR